MPQASYERKRGQLEAYFDRTAIDAWARLTSDAPVSRIRATVRAGRDRMRATLLDWLPRDLRGRRVLDAGCGTGALAVEAARRGAAVTAVDLSPRLVELARERLPSDVGEGSVEFRVGDMLAATNGAYDHVVCMDSLIHYRLDDILGVLPHLAQCTGESIVFTFAPRTPLLTAMHGIGRLFPRGDRAPMIQPVGASRLREAIAQAHALAGWRAGRTARVSSGFYISQGLELTRS
jgi:magnesium-protoporphyrin O-methyltransferase